MDFKYLDVRQREHTFKLLSIPAGLLTKISYASVRRKDDEEGAVQRILNSSRISGVKDFALKLGDFPASIVLNWVGPALVTNRDMVTIVDQARMAQIIDGQHRVAGLAAAIEEDPNVAKFHIPIALYEGLDTSNSARIFISINTEQRPAPKSLVLDLYGVTASDLMDPSAMRASDIVSYLGSSERPYDGWIKLPNQDRKRGGVALSTAVSAIKPLVDDKGLLDQIGVSSLETQQAIFNNYFSALRERYGPYWNDRSNVFIYAAGFIGAIEFFRTKLVDYCKLKGSFEKTTIFDAIVLDETSLILQENVKGFGGAEAANVVRDQLSRAFRPDEQSQGFKI